MRNIYHSIVSVHLDTSIGTQAGNHTTEVKAAINQNFMSKMRCEMLGSLVRHVRNLEKTTFDDQVPASFATQVASQATAAPWIGSLEWYIDLEQQSETAAQLQASENYLEASMIWSEVVYRLQFSRPPLGPLFQKMQSLKYTSHVNSAICCMHCLGSLTLGFSTTYYRELGEYALDMLKAIDFKNYKEHFCLKYFFAFARITRLLSMRLPQNISMHSISGKFLEYAAALDPDNESIADKLKAWEECRSALHPSED